jgi:hypothetical protein
VPSLLQKVAFSILWENSVSLTTLGGIENSELDAEMLKEEIKEFIKLSFIHPFIPSLNICCMSLMDQAWSIRYIAVNKTKQKNLSFWTL